MSRDGSRIAALLAARDRRSLEPRGTLVLGPALCQRVETSGSPHPDASTVPGGAPVYGTWEEEAGEPLVRAVSTEGGPGLRVVGTLGPPRPSEPGLVQVTSSPASASLDGRPMRLVFADPGRYRDRVLAVPGIEGLRGRKAMIVGCGSVGSDIGARLAALGVVVTSLDPDVLSMENLIRWGLDASPAHDVGRRKVLVWERILRATIPGAAVSGVPMDVVRDPGGFDAILEDHRPDLLIVATDTRDSRRAVTLTSVRHRLPVLFVALSDGAATLRLEVVEDAASGPCHLCSSAHEGGASPERTERRSLTPYAAQDAPADVAVPALPLNVAMANAVAARVAASHLAGAGWRAWFRRGAQEGTVMFVSLEPAAWVFDEPWMRLVYQPERVDGCPACGQDWEVGHA